MITLGNLQILFLGAVTQLIVILALEARIQTFGH
jgi:hypothetical protein